MKRDYRTLFGLLLIGGGVLLALQQFNVLRGDWNDAIFTSLWALAALYFFDLYNQNRPQWWFGLVAFIFGALAVTHALDLFFPAIGDAIGGAIFLGGIGAGFIIAYRRNPANWWAIIPAGVMFTLALISVANDLPYQWPFETGGVLFIGIGLTFLILTQIRVDGERLSWAIFPAIPLLALGLIVGLGDQASWDYIWPTLIILFGLYFLISSLRK